jgi:sigma-B regulation protein RsbU (phosphoserine phosphatase)
MIRDLEEKKTLEKELALAHETQVGLLPRQVPEVEGLRIRAYNRPTRYVSGDFYDFIEAGGERLVAVLADVSGKGVAAALLGSSLQGALQTLLRSGLGAKAALDAANAYVCERSEEHRFVTLFLVDLGPGGDGIYLNAGHVPAYLFRAATGEVEEQTAGDLILGMFDYVSYQQRPLRLDEGDMLFIYSDGLTDAANAAGEMFGEERLRSLVAEMGGRGADRLEHGILQALESFVAGVEQTDDITFLVIERPKGSLIS